MCAVSRIEAEVGYGLIFGAKNQAIGLNYIPY
jgi:hypothetical protein